MSTEPRQTSPGASPWLRPAVLGASCVVIGFVGGWVLHGGGDSTSTIPKVSDDFAKSLTAQSPPSRTITVDDGATQGPGAVPPPDRGTVTVMVLNATNVSGLAARQAERLRRIAYQNVSTGNVAAGGQAGASTVYYRAGQRPAATQVASDLLIPAAPEPLPASGEITRAAAAAASAGVVVVLRAA